MTAKQEAPVASRGQYGTDLRTSYHGGGNWQRARRGRPCPICGKPDYCGVTPDGAFAVCMRVQDGSIKPTRNGGFLHRIGNPPWRRPSTRSIVLTPRLPSRHDLATLVRKYETAVNPARLQRLADGLGLSTDSLHRLRVGWSYDHGAWSFPMTDGAGTVLGIRLRLPSGRKFSVLGGREGLFAPHDLPQVPTLLITEGATDCAALLDMGFATVGRPSCTGGVRLLTDLVIRRRPGGVVIVADADEPGQRGADALAAVLAVYCADVRVTGSIPGARSDIDQIIRRKQERDDFDVLLLQDMSRFTRSGPQHEMKLEYDLTAAGIELVFAADHLPEGDHSGIIKSVSYYSAKQYAKSLSFAVARGSMSSLLADRVAHCIRVPYGVDRLYRSADGRRAHIIRNLTDGTQVKLDPQTKALLETYERSQNGRSLHYRKQANECVELIPGADEQVAAVRQMYRRHLIDGWGGYRITMELNRQGVFASEGKPWSVSSVLNILQNPVYTGVGLANRLSQAIYNMRSPNAPKPAQVAPEALLNRKKPKPIVRPRADWIEDEHPALRDYLGDEHLRELAVEMQRKYLARQASGIKAIPNKDRHVNSEFLLKGILRSKQGGYAMSGRCTGKGIPRHRYYGINRTICIPTTDRTLRRLIPAQAIETAVLAAVRETLLGAPELRETLRRTIEDRLAAATKDGGELEKLIEERDRLRQQFEFIIGDVGTMGRELLKPKLQQLEGQLEALNGRIVKASAAAAGAGVDVNATVEAILARLSRMVEDLDQLPTSALRQLLSILIARLEVDLETRSFELELALPDWAVLDQKAYERAMCLDSSFAQRPGNQAHGLMGPILAIFRCEGSGRPPCFACQRLRQAA